MTKAFLQSPSNNKTTCKHYNPFTNPQRPAKVFWMSSFLKCSEHKKVDFVTKNLSMLAVHEIVPSVLLLDVLWKWEEMKACWIAFSIIIAISTAKSGTWLPLLFEEEGVSCIGKVSAIVEISWWKQQSAAMFHCNLLRLVTQLNTSLAIMFAWLQIQYGAVNCKKGFCLIPVHTSQNTKMCECVRVYKVLCCNYNHTLFYNF